MAKVKADVNIEMGEFPDEIKKVAKAISAGMAHQAAETLDNATVNALGAFYGDYTPKVYRRHYYNFMDLSHRKYHASKHGTSYRGGVELNPDWMDSMYQGKEMYKDPVDEVFNAVYLYGIHGLVSKPVAWTRPSPLHQIYDARDRIAKKADKYLGYGFARAKEYSYETLKITGRSQKKWLKGLL